MYPSSSSDFDNFPLSGYSPARDDIAATGERQRDADIFPSLKPRGEAVEQLRRILGKGRRDIRQRFESRQLSGFQAARALARLTDEAVDILANDAGLAQTGGICLCATGGYGAGLLAPFSDVDLLFLTSAPPAPIMEEQIRYVLYTLWDLGLRVGHATRTITECLAIAREDLVTCTALVDIRPLSGDAALNHELQQGLHDALEGDALEAFITAKIKERETRHIRFGDTPYLVEPNLKEGRGGLRDLQALGWMSRSALAALPPGKNAERKQMLESLSNLDEEAWIPASAILGLLTRQEIYRMRKVWDFLWAVRLHLHYITGRAEERITFDVQPILAARMGYGHHGHQRAGERFMRHYFLVARNIMRLTHVLQPAIMLYVHNKNAGQAAHIEALPEGHPGSPTENLCLIDGLLGVKTQEIFAKEPQMLFELLDYARHHQLRLHPATIQQLIRHERYSASLRGNAEAANLFLSLISDPVIPQKPQHVGVSQSGKEAHQEKGQQKERFFWLPLLNETGILPRFIAPWSRILGRTQFDGYHLYTVDEHTIESIRILRQLEAGQMADEIPVAYTLARSLSHAPRARQNLYLALLLHDIGKGRDGDHSEIGASLALKICRQLHLGNDEAETVSALVAHHLLLSHTAFTRDIDDPQTIFDLADIIQSPEQLRLLLLLTIADIRAVGPRAWNAWKATLLQKLYHRVADVLEGGLQTCEDDDRVHDTRNHLRHVLKENLPETFIEHFLSLGKAGYWLGFDPQTHLRHAMLLHHYDNAVTQADSGAAAADNTPVAITVDSLPQRDISELTILCPDRPGVFSLIAGALAMRGATISDARIHTLNNKMVLDSFWIQTAQGGAFEEDADIASLKDYLADVLAGRVNLSEALSTLSRPNAQRMDSLPIPSRVMIDNDSSERATILEINNRDRPALLHDITCCLSRNKAVIQSAHIATYGLRAVDVFYLSGLDGGKITEPHQLQNIQDALMAVLTSSARV